MHFNKFKNKSKSPGSDKTKLQMVGVKIKRTEFFNLWRSVVGAKNLQKTILERFGLCLNEEELDKFNQKVYYWAKRMESRWHDCSRNIRTFLHKQVKWLNGDIILVERHPNVGGRPKKPFAQLSERNKTRAVQK